MTPAIVVAIIAAVASIAAAVMSALSADAARSDARATLKASRLVDAHDHVVAQFREDVAYLLRSIVKVGYDGQGEALAGVSILAMNPLCTEPLREIVSKLVEARIRPDAPMDNLDDLVKRLEDEAREVLKQADNARRALLTPEPAEQPSRLRIVPRGR